MKRGEVVLVAPPGAYGKPRPALIVQSDLLSQAGLGSAIVCLMTSHLENASYFRVDVSPAPENGLKMPSQVMADKLFTVPRARIGRRIGRVDKETLAQVTLALSLCLGIAEPN